MSGLRSIRLVSTREIGLKLRSRTFRVSTTITALIVVGLVAVPRALPGPNQIGSDQYSLGVSGDFPVDLERALVEAADLMEVEYEVTEYRSADEAETAVRNDEVDAAITDARTLIVRDAREPRLNALVEGALQQYSQARRLQAAGLTPQQVDELMLPAPGIDLRVLEPGPRDGPAGAAGGFGVAFIAVVAMFGAILLYSQWVMSGVLEEKSSRVVEVVLGAITPRQLLAGKVLGMGGLGLLHLLILAVAGGLAAVATGAGIPRIGLATAAAAVVWFLLGYALYSMLAGTAAALVSRQEDLQVAFFPVMAIAMVSYLFSFGAAQRPDEPFAQIGSLIPTVAPFLMPARVAQGAVSLTEQAAAAGLMLATIWILAVVGSRLYTGAILRFGPRIKLKEAWKKI